jgi:hypothetical protein
MNTNDSWNVVDRKMLELRILTNANWKNQEYELAVMGEKMLRSIEAAKAQAESARSIMARLPESVNELRDAGKLQNVFEAQSLQSLKF